MSSDQSRPEKLDPLTAPTWPITVEASPLDPHMALARDENTIHHRTIPAPPDVDQILSGEYTGWVPIIRAGESLDDAQTRANLTVTKIEQQIVHENSLSQTQFNTSEGPRTTSEVLGSIGPEFVVTPPGTPQVATRSRVDYFIPDPDSVDSPADALEIARQRIAQMRESLQKSLTNVTKSFDHPIFKPENQPINQPPVTHTRVMPPQREEVKPAPTESQPIIQEPNTQSRVEEPVTHYRVQEQVVEDELRATPQFTVDEVAVKDHSLELVIMRDEIKDLRARLDASQKLIEDLMHRITNLAELALKGRQN
jgi:hypothetical protein